jgi:hypothetical protein
MYANILLSTDGSDVARKGVERGIALAKALNAKVTVITVTEPLPVGNGSRNFTAPIRKDKSPSLTGMAAVTSAWGSDGICSSDGRVAAHVQPRRRLGVVTWPVSAGQTAATPAAATAHNDLRARPLLVLLVKDVEGRQAHVGDFLIIQCHLLTDRSHWRR